jgi:hypothetical protein
MEAKRVVEISEGGRDAAIRHALRRSLVLRMMQLLALAGFVIAQISHDMPTARLARRTR